MNSFEAREKAAENKFSHDEELNFKVNARAHKLLGLWAAGHMHMSDEDSAKAYAMDIVDMNFSSKNKDEVIERIYHDITDAGVDIEYDDIGEELVHCLDKARQQIYHQ